jgi:hypothetical protein
MNNVLDIMSGKRRADIVVSDKYSDLPMVGEAHRVKYRESGGYDVLAIFRDGKLVTELEPPKLSKAESESPTLVPMAA